ncbi:hypothetical protein [Sphaerimonospora mesophila]|uniref:hypothetical protein n=1 Tax=Sphaerimonospora mesophila TaxID=37483 RepID=UPI0006E1E22E
MSLRRYFSVLAGSAALCLGATILAPSPAMAAPTDCTTWMSGGYAYSKCTGGTGEHSVAIYAYSPYAGGPVLVTGNWAPVGGTSSARITAWGVERIWVNKRG